MTLMKMTANADEDDTKSNKVQDHSRGYIEIACGAGEEFNIILGRQSVE